MREQPAAAEARLKRIPRRSRRVLKKGVGTLCGAVSRRGSLVEWLGGRDAAAAIRATVVGFRWRRQRWPHEGVNACRGPKIADLGLGRAVQH